jgi:hypothetical protein
MNADNCSISDRRLSANVFRRFVAQSAATNSSIPGRSTTVSAAPEHVSAHPSFRADREECLDRYSRTKAGLIREDAFRHRRIASDNLSYLTGFYEEPVIRRAPRQRCAHGGPKFRHSQTPPEVFNSTVNKAIH